jgi:hypothetical protein
MALLLVLATTLNCATITDLFGASPTQDAPAFSEEDSPLSELYLQLESLGAFAAAFRIEFEGRYRWLYQLDTRSDGEALEYLLHIEGVSTARNPGDVRLVNAAGVNRMRGPGTDGQCVQFPDSIDMGFSFLTPDDLIDIDSISEVSTAGESVPIAARSATPYEVSQDTLAEWSNVEVVYWLDNESGAILRLSLQAQGPDPLFDAGQGTITAEFLVSEIGAQVIEPVPGCEIEIPVPDDIGQVIRLPGLISFESPSTIDALGEFFHQALLDEGWERVTLPQTTQAGSTVLSYVNETQTLDIKLDPTENGAAVEIFLAER